MSYSMEGYVDVAERIREFRAKYPNGCLRPFNPAEPFRVMEIGGREFIVYTAAAFRSPEDTLPAVAVAAELAVGKTNFTRESEVMNAETSAWGRAIVALLVADTQRVASLEEVRNRQAEDVVKEAPKTPYKPRTQAKSEGASVTALSSSASSAQLGLIKKLAKEKNVANIDQFVQVLLEDTTKTATAITKVEASKVITALMAEKVEDVSDEQPF
jgi:hypothetical protein